MISGVRGQRSGVSGQESAVNTGRGLVGLLSPVSWLLILAAALLVPIVAHGCHGDDVDHEPGTGPPARYHEPENAP